jgi:hypothetical protein
MPDALLGGRDDCHAVIIHHPGNKSSYDCCLVAILLPGKQLHFWMIFLELLLFIERQLLRLSFKLVTVYFVGHTLLSVHSLFFLALVICSLIGFVKRDKKIPLREWVVNRVLSVFGWEGGVQI